MPRSRSRSRLSRLLTWGHESGGQTENEHEQHANEKLPSRSSLLGLVTRRTRSKSRDQSKARRPVSVDEDTASAYPPHEARVAAIEAAGLHAGAAPWNGPESLVEDLKRLSMQNAADGGGPSTTSEISSFTSSLASTPPIPGIMGRTSTDDNVQARSTIRQVSGGSEKVARTNAHPLGPVNIPALKRKAVPELSPPGPLGYEERDRETDPTETTNAEYASPVEHGQAAGWRAGVHLDEQRPDRAPESSRIRTPQLHGLDGIVDLRDTTDTTVDTRTAPAITHETVRVDTHEIREERITREVHDYSVHHRVLPIVDVEVLPARHFMSVDGGYIEVAEDELPAVSALSVQQKLRDAASQVTVSENPNKGPRQFTARMFKGTDGDSQCLRAPEGHLVTHTTWVHPPTVEEGGTRTGQTYPFHLGSPNSADDGLRATLPEGKVIGISPVLAHLRATQTNTHPDLRSGP